MEKTSPRYLGTDPATGRSIYVSAEPGGALDLLTDQAAVESAAALQAVVCAVIDGGQATVEELAVFVPALAQSLGEVTALAAKHLDRAPVNESGGAAFRALRGAVRGSWSLPDTDTAED